MYFYFGIFINSQSVFEEVPKRQRDAVPVTLTAVLLSMKSPVAPTDFSITLFEVVLSASVFDFVYRFYLYLYLHFSKSQKFITFNKYSTFDIYVTHKFITKTMFILSSDSSSLQFRSINHSWILPITIVNKTTID